MANGNLRTLKVTMVGVGMVGRSCMLNVYTRKESPMDSFTTVFDTCAENITVDGNQYNVNLWDTPGRDDYDRLRPLSYPNTNCFIICYSITSRSSYKSVAQKWFPEVKHYSPTIPIVLVATKVDARHNSTKEDNFITTQEGEKLKKKIRAAAFVECSALTGENLIAVFEESVRAAVRKPPMISSSCHIL